MIFEPIHTGATALIACTFIITLGVVIVSIFDTCHKKKNAIYLTQKQIEDQNKFFKNLDTLFGELKEKKEMK